MQVYGAERFLDPEKRVETRGEMRKIEDLVTRLFLKIMFRATHICMYTHIYIHTYIFIYIYVCDIVYMAQND